MRDRADADGTDLLVIDSGDRIEGNGLYDGSKPKGAYIFDIFKQQHIDLICSGNHELYKPNSSENEYHITAPNFRGKYLASNLDIVDSSTEKIVPLADRYRIFTTKNQGIKIAAFGFLYNFKGNANNTAVQPVQKTVKERWFQDVIRENVDLFVVVCHMGVKTEEVDVIYKAIRDVNWDTPIQFFGGHWHIRAYRKLDNSAYALASGRYMETVGFMSINGINVGKNTPLTSRSPSFRRRYIDHNLYSLQYHTNATKFVTKQGKKATGMITKARTELHLDKNYGCAPKDLWLNRVPFGSNDSIFAWLEHEVIPSQLSDNQNAEAPKIILANTGAMRFDIFKGLFTKDTTYLVSPFTSGFRRIRSINYGIASRLTMVLNSDDPVFTELASKLDVALLAPPENQQLLFNNVTDVYSTVDQSVFQHRPALLPGYTTVDDDGDDGDDTIHSPVPAYVLPNCMETRLGSFVGLNRTSNVDVVYNEFLEPYIIVALGFLGLDYRVEDTVSYKDGKSLTDMISDWVRNHWSCN